MDADGIVGILVGILRVHALGQRGEGICQTGVLLEFLTLIGSEFAVALYVFQALVDVYIAGCLVQQ